MQERGEQMGKQIWGGTAVEGRGIHWPGCTTDDPEVSGMSYSPSEYSLNLGDENLTPLQLMQEGNVKTKSLQEPRNEMENIFQMSVIENKVRVVKRNWVIFSYLCGWYINHPGHGPDETFQATAHVSLNWWTCPGRKTVLVKSEKYKIPEASWAVLTTSIYPGTSLTHRLPQWIFVVKGG